MIENVEKGGRDAGENVTDVQVTGSHAFAVLVNGKKIRIDDSTPTARQILVASAHNPADEHVLIQVLKTRTQSVALDETVDLRARDRELFFAFESDRIFRFTLDGRGYEWGAPKISEATLRDLARVEENEVIVLEREDEPDQELGPDDVVVLNADGTEHLKVERGLVAVCIDGEEKEIPRGVYTTEELLKILGVADGYLLNVISPNGQLEALESGQKIRVRKGMKFISQVPCGGSS